MSNSFDQYMARIQFWKDRVNHTDEAIAEEAKRVVAFYNSIGVLPRWAVTLDSLLTFDKDVRP
jgi:hypothetical protein